jgi:N-acetylglutamate synthase-like GNAT family acetyltransferase
MRAYTIRTAAPADAAAICAILIESALSTHAVLAAGTRQWLAQRADGVLIGAEIGTGAVLLRSAAVRPEARGQGIGAALLRRALNEAAAAGCRRAYLFSTDAGTDWSGEGTRDVSAPELVAALPNAPQVRRYDHRAGCPMRWRGAKI